MARPQFRKIGGKAVCIVSPKGGLIKSRKRLGGSTISAQDKRKYKQEAEAKKAEKEKRKQAEAAE